MEFTAPQAGDVEVLRLRDDLEIGLGCVSVTPGQVVRRSSAVSSRPCATCLPAHHPQPRLRLCTRSAAEVSIDEVYTKLKNEVAAAQLLRGDHVVHCPLPHRRK